MSLSGYQVESFLNELRQYWGLRTDRPAYYEPSHISKEGKEWSQNMPQPKQHTPNSTWIYPSQIIEFIDDATIYDPIIEWERQRRAGLFTNPIYIPENPPAVFSLVKDHSVETEQPKYDTALPTEVTAQNVSENIQNNTKEPVSNESELTPAPQPTNQDFDIDLEEGFEVDEEIIGNEDQLEADVVYGNGRITEESTIAFLKDYPESALKFLLDREANGKPLSAETIKIHNRWKQRGLFRQKLYQYICEIMNWDQIPKDNIAKLFAEIEDKVLDLD